jgi:hypothetical protein
MPTRHLSYLELTFEEFLTMREVSGIVESGISF